jgi:hypothetical protein
MNSSIPKRIFAVDPGMQYLGVALLEGEELIWYAVKTFRDARTCHQTRTQVHDSRETGSMLYLLLQKKKCGNCGRLSHKDVLYC